MSTTAIRDGDHYIVNGSKTFITNGINADLVITAVKTDPRERHQGMSLLVLERDREARVLADDLRTHDGFPTDVADALAMISAQDVAGYALAVESVLESFETREDYLEDVPVADTVIVLQTLAVQRNMAADLESPLLQPAHPSDQAEQGRLADTVGADHRRGAAEPEVQRDVVCGKGLAVAMRQALGADRDLSPRHRAASA